jgi:hypothetical protein
LKNVRPVVLHALQLLGKALLFLHRLHVLGMERDKLLLDSGDGSGPGLLEECLSRLEHSESSNRGRSREVILLTLLLCLQLCLCLR